MRTKMLLAVPLFVLLFSGVAMAQIIDKDPIIVPADDIAIIQSDTSEIKDTSNQIFDIVNQIRLDTGGTEYLPNDNATIYARMLDANSRPINIGACNSTVFLPNKTKLLNNVALTFLEKGVYFHDFTLPSDTGVYITTFDCMFPSSLFSQNKTFFQTLTASGISSIISSFAFDNSNNLTINSASTTISFMGSGGAAFNYLLNGNQIFTSPVGVSNTTTIRLFSSNFTIGEEQSFSVTRSSGSPTINWVSLSVNFTVNEPQQTVRGQDEIHVGTGLQQIPIQTAIISAEYQRLSNHNLCLNDMTLQHNISVQIGNQPPTPIIATEDCPFGCDTENNRCNPSPFDTLIYYIIGGVVGVIVLIIIVLRLVK